jgi:beta-lactamase class A
MTTSKAQPGLTTVRVNSQAYKFINPLLYVDNASSTYPELSDLNSSLSTFIQSKQASGDATDVSVYYRDMTNGHWTGINQNDTYEPSSMLKVLVLMAYLKHALSDPSILSHELPYSKAADESQTYKPSNPLVDGRSYPVANLLTSMITTSDNGSLKALNAYDPRDISDVYQALDLPIPSATSSQDINSANFMSAQEYSRVFRTIFNGTYLSWNLSEQALELLSQTDFKNGLVAGTPAGTVISHKFGERTNQLTDGTVAGRELHDCGIVYYPDHPYFLCVMTKGKDFSKLEGVISGLSKIAYGYVNALPKK